MSKESSTGKRRVAESDRAFRARRARRGRKSGLVRRWVLPKMGLGAVVLGLLLVIAWVVGLVMNDRAAWSQYLWWIPTGFVVGVAWIAVVVSKVCEWAGTRLSGAHLRPIVLVAALAATVWMLGFEWRVQRVVFGMPGGFAKGPSARVLYWNLAAATADGVTERVMDEQADVYIFANPKISDGRAHLMSAMREQARVWRDEAIDAVREDGDATGEGVEEGLDSELADIPATLNHTRVARFSNTTIVSRYPVVESVWRPLTDLDTAWAWRPTEFGFEGVGYVVLDAVDRFGEPLVIWVIDLPSNVALHRAEVMRAARALVDGSGGEVGGDGGSLGAFPEPSLIVGDFNTPRGSASLALLVGDRESAYAQAGVGPGTTWPRPLEQLAIDLAFVSEGWRAHDYERVDLGHGLHRAVLVELGR